MTSRRSRSLPPATHPAAPVALSVSARRTRGASENQGFYGGQCGSQARIGDNRRPWPRASAEEMRPRATARQRRRQWPWRRRWLFSNRRNWRRPSQTWRRGHLIFLMGFCRAWRRACGRPRQRLSLCEGLAELVTDGIRGLAMDTCFALRPSGRIGPLGRPGLNREPPTRHRCQSVTSTPAQRRISRTSSIWSGVKSARLPSCAPRR